MGKLTALRTDPNKESQGVWIDYEDDIKLKLGRMNSPAFEKFVADRQATSIGRFRRVKQSDAERDKLVEEAVASTIILDWKNIQDDSGNDIPYSKEKALEFCRDPGLRDFYRFVLIEASQADNFKKEILEQAAGN